jgi:1,5-anhydro-D-fructose reductase (1,5-anhydro-D-mannitol-forming)
MNTIRWGIIGCGDVTEVKSGPGFAKADGSSLVAVMRRNGARAADYARRHGVPRWYDDADALVGDAEVDAVYVATPPAAHKEHVLRAARAGKPVYVEKPMALDLGECEAMIAACRAAGVPLFTAYYRRALPRFLKVKALMDGGEIGEVRAVRVALERPASLGVGSWRVDPAIAGGGHFVDLASHTIDLLDYLLGPITRVGGDAANQNGGYAAEDIVCGEWSFASGVRGVGQWCFSGGGNLDRVEIVGTVGRVTFATFDEAPVVLEKDGVSTPFTIPHPPHVQQPLIQTVVDELRGQGRCPSTGDSGARTTAVMDQLLQSWRTLYGSSLKTQGSGDGTKISSDLP